MNEYRFYKDELGWWIDLPAYVENGGNRDDLAMVCGADDLLDRLDVKNQNEVKMILSDRKKEFFSRLMRCDEIPTKTGSYYFDDDSDSLLWLCNVTRWLFKGKFPETIWYKVI